MKTLLFTLLFTMITLLSFAQFPLTQNPDSNYYISKDLRVAILTNNDSKIDVKIAKTAGELVKIRVLEGDKVLYQKRFKKWDIVDMEYDIAQFPEGVYKIEVIKEKAVVFEKQIIKNSSHQLCLQ